MIALLIIDMQVGLFEGNLPRHDAEGVIRRVNEITAAVRAAGGLVVFIQHENKSVLKRGTDGWEILPELDRLDTDLLVHKKTSDSFYKTELDDLLQQHGAQQIVVTGCATDYCVDTTLRAAAIRNYDVRVASNAHTTRDRPHLDAQSIIKRHNWLWKNLSLSGSKVKVLSAAKIVKWLRGE